MSKEPGASVLGGCPLGRFRSKKPTPECPWAADKIKKLSDLTRSVINKELSRDVIATSNTTPLVRLARKLIKSSSLVFLKTDKDGGFAAAEAAGVIAERRRMLAGSEYRKVLKSSHITEEKGQELRNIFSRICIAEYGEKFCSQSTQLFNELSHDFRGRTLADSVATLDMTVKTHKPNGEAVGRAIHAATKSPLKPLMRYLSFCLHRALRGMEHLILDTRDLADKLSKKKIGKNRRMFNN